MDNYRYSCKICKKLAVKDHNKGICGKYLLLSMLEYKTKEEAIEHINKHHTRLKEISTEKGK